MACVELFDSHGIRRLRWLRATIDNGFDDAKGWLEGEIDFLSIKLGLDVVKLYILLLEREAIEIRKHRRITELSDGEIIRELTQCINIRCKRKVAVGGGFHEYRTKNKYLIRNPRLNYLCNRLSVVNCFDLIVRETDKVAKKLVWLTC